MLTRLSNKRNRLVVVSLLLGLLGSRVWAGNGASDAPTKADWTLVYVDRVAAQKKALTELSVHPQSGAWCEYCALAQAGLPAAAEQAQRACLLEPNNYSFVTTLAMVTYLAGDARTAEKLAARAAQLHHPNGRALAVLAVCKELAGQSDEAQKLADEAVRAGGDDYELNLFIYGLYSTRRDQEKCLEAAGRLIAACPTSAVPYLLRGKIYRDRNEMDAASLDFRHAHELDPNNAATTIALARLLERTGHQEEAVSCFTSLIQMAPSAELYYRRAESLSALGKIAEAEADYDEAIRMANSPAPANTFVLTPRNLKFREYKICWVRKTELLEQLGKTQEAMASAAELLRTDPNCDVALQVHQSTARKLEHYGEAVSDLNKLIAMDNDVADWFRYRGEALAALHQNQQADRDLAIAKRIDEFGE